MSGSSDVQTQARPTTADGDYFQPDLDIDIPEEERQAFERLAQMRDLMREPANQQRRNADGNVASSDSSRETWK
ncbi:MAG: hypothetical protein AAFP90_04240 [Planctomycetota bacterium]